MIILLDENFPLRFYTRLQREGYSECNRRGQVFASSYNSDLTASAVMLDQSPI